MGIKSCALSLLLAFSVLSGNTAQALTVQGPGASSTGYLNPENWASSCWFDTACADVATYRDFGYFGVDPYLSWTFTLNAAGSVAFQLTLAGNVTGPNLVLAAATTYDWAPVGLTLYDEANRIYFGYVNNLVAGSYVFRTGVLGGGHIYLGGGRYGCCDGAGYSGLIMAAPSGAVTAVPVPEPASVALFGSCLMLIWGVRRRTLT